MWTFIYLSVSLSGSHTLPLKLLQMKYLFLKNFVPSKLPQSTFLFLEHSSFRDIHQCFAILFYKEFIQPADIRKFPWEIWWKENYPSEVPGHSAGKTGMNITAITKNKSSPFEKGRHIALRMMVSMKGPIHSKNKSLSCDFDCDIWPAVENSQHLLHVWQCSAVQCGTFFLVKKSYQW